MSHETHDDRKEKAEKLYLEFIIAQAIFICFLVGCAGQHVRGDDEREREKYIFEARLQTDPQRNAYIVMWEKSGVKEDVGCQKCHGNQVYRVV